MISPMALIPNESYAADGKVRDVFASKHWIGEGLLSNEVTNHRLLTVAPQHTSPVTSSCAINIYLRIGGGNLKVTLVVIPTCIQQQTFYLFTQPLQALSNE